MKDAILNNSISTAILLLIYNAFFIIAYYFFDSGDFNDLGIFGFTRYLRNEIIAYLLFFILALAIEYGIFSMLLKRRGFSVKESKVFKAVFFANIFSFGIMYIWVYLTLGI